MPKEKQIERETQKVVSSEPVMKGGEFQRVELEGNPVEEQQEERQHFKLVQIEGDTGGLSAFNFQGTSMYRQHDATQRKDSKTKSKRHAAEKEQGEADRVRHSEMDRESGRLVKNDPNHIIYLSVNGMDNGCMRTERKDVTGYERRRRMQSYQGKAYQKTKGGQELPVEKVRRRAVEDADNLVDNLRKDIFLEADMTMPEELTLFTDAYHFTQLYGDSTIHHCTEQEKGLTGAPLADAKIRRKKVEKLILWQKQNGATFTAELMVKKRNIRACQLAMHQMESEGLEKDYNRLIHQELARRLQDMQTEYDRRVEEVRTLKDNTQISEEQKESQLNAQAQLARLGRRLRTEDLTDDEKKQLEEQGRQIILNYSYPGELRESK